MDNGIGLLQTLRLHKGEVTSCDISLEYLLAIGSSDKLVRLVEWKTGLGFVDVSYSPLKHHKHGVTSVRFSPKGTMLASSSLDGTALLFDVSTGNVIFTMVQYNTTSIRFCEFTFDSTKLITAGDDGMLCFWNLVTHSQIRNFRVHDEEFCVKALAISPDSEYLLSADTESYLKLWFIGNISENKPDCLSYQKNLHDGIFSCDFSPSIEFTGDPVIKYKYLIATCGADSLITVWRYVIERKEKSEPGLDSFDCDMIPLRDLKGHTNDVLSIRFNSTGNYLISTGLDNLIILWEVSTGNCVETLEGHTSFGTCSSFSKDSLLLVTGSNDKTVIIWALAQNLTLDSQLIKPCNTNCHFTNIDLINYKSTRETPDEEKKINDEFNVIQQINSSSVINSVHIQGNYLAMAGGEKSVAIWKRKEGTLLYELIESVDHHKYSVNQLEISSCGSKVISSSKDGVIMFWDINVKLAHEMRTPGFANSLRTCRFSPDSMFIAAAGDDQEVFLWNATNLEFMKIIQSHDNAITSVAFTPDSKFLASTCCGGDIKLYSFEQEKSVFEINSAHDLGAMCCDFSLGGIPKKDRDNYLLATCGNDSLINLWEVQDMEIQILQNLLGHNGVVTYVRFSPGEPFILASCASDKTVRIWNVKLNQCLHVLNHHKSAVTTCSFSKDSLLLATGSLDKSVCLCQLTQQICHEPLASKINFGKLLQYWTVADIVKWFMEIGCPEFAEKINLIQLDGRKLLSISDELITDLMELENEKEYKVLKKSLQWLRHESISFSFDNLPITENIPHKFLCPITHKIMKNPVICSDGFIYDRCAITEWFLSGKFTSPMTKEYLPNTNLLPYSALKKNIYEFLYTSEYKI